jgi:hypothetical protein
MSDLHEQIEDAQRDRDLASLDREIARLRAELSRLCDLRAESVRNEE